MNYANIKTFDISNGAGVRVSLFVSGCTRHCKECFNEEAWDFNYGKKFTYETMDYILNLLRSTFIDGLSVLGGEPFEPDNVKTVYEIIKRVKEVYPKKDIWVWSGYTFEYLKEYYAYLFEYIDVLVDGPFIVEEKDITLRFRGSSNQRIIDIPKSIEKEEVVIWTDGPILSTHKSYEE